MSVCRSVWIEQLGSHWTDFNEIWHLSIFWKCIKKIQVPLKSVKNNGYFAWRPMYIVDHILLISSYNVEMFETKVVEKITTHVLCSVTFLWKSCSLWDNVEKYVGAGQATEDNIVHALCMLDNWARTHARTHARARARTHKHTHFSTSNSGCMNSVQCYITCTLPVLNETFCGIYWNGSKNAQSGSQCCRAWIHFKLFLHVHYSKCLFQQMLTINLVITILMCFLVFIGF
jgi:hypothetical protein